MPVFRSGNSRIASRGAAPDAGSKVEGFDITPFSRPLYVYSDLHSFNRDVMFLCMDHPTGRR